MSRNSSRLRKIRAVACILAFLTVLLPSSALGDSGAQGFSVSPTEVNVANLPAGGAAEFGLTIRNQDETATIFVVSAFQPPEEERRAGYSEWPDDSWISFSPQEVEVGAHSEVEVRVTVAVPEGPEWVGRDWEIWLGVAAVSDELLAVKPCVRLLVSTQVAADAGRYAGLVVGIAAGAILIGYGIYYYARRKVRVRS
jgi:hypothetical protein